MTKTKPKKFVPAATINATFSTYANSKQRSLNQRIGNVVDITMEGLCMAEIGGWGSNLRITSLPNVEVKMRTNANGTSTIWFSPKS